MSAKARKTGGSILFLVVLAIGIIVAVCLLGFMFNQFLCQRSRAQVTVDALALSFASRMNEGNRIGQINDLQEQSRELVYLSRQNCRECMLQDSGFLAPLCYELLVEARSGHQMVERERGNLIQTISAELQQNAVLYNDSIASNKPLKFLGLETGAPVIREMWIGSAAGIDSNVKLQEGLPALAAFDRGKKYVDNSSNLFRSDINAKLPDDSDLDFKLSSLAANVDGSCAPARNANSDVFCKNQMIFAHDDYNTHEARSRSATEPFTDSPITAAPETLTSASGQLPDAVQVICTMTTGIGGRRQVPLRIVSTGIASGDVAKSP